MQVLRAVLILVFLCWPPPGAPGFTSFEESGGIPYDQCRAVSVVGQFSAEGSSTYRLTGDCSLSPRALLWNAQGTYSPKDGRTEERIVLDGQPPFRGEIRTTMTCDGDPWLGSPSCIDMQTHAQGDVSSATSLLAALHHQVLTRKSPLITGLSFQRKQLLAQREADLQAAVAKGETEVWSKAEVPQPRLAQATWQKASLTAPIIQAPTAGQQFLNGTPVPIKLAPPADVPATSYVVSLQRQDHRGQWIDHGVIPIGAAQAQSQTGYTGFGAGAPPTFFSAPGAWRLRAQVSAPTPSVWSNWTEFAVLAPPSANSFEKGMAGAFR